MQHRILFYFILFLGFGLVSENTYSNPDALNVIVTGKQRSETHKNRDQYRHPIQTLNFFEVKSDMKVVEIWPGGGWYTEILAPYLKDHGQYVAAQFNSAKGVAFYTNIRKKFEEKIKQQSEYYKNTQITTFDPGTQLKITQDGSADRVLTFRNVHNWTRGGDEAVLNAFKIFFKALKKGGILGVVEHRLPESADNSMQGRSGYMKESYVRKMAEKAGFKFVASSEINANAKDNAHHPKGVWTLPPMLRMGDKDKEKYIAIGESDRMTLKFIKP